MSRSLTFTTRLGSSHLVMVGGLAELFSGAISMGLGAYLAAVTERSHYIAEEQKQRKEVMEKPAAERAAIHRIFREYEIDTEVSEGFVQALERNPEMWIKVRRPLSLVVGGLPPWHADTILVHDELRPAAPKAQRLKGVHLCRYHGGIILHR